MKIVLDANKCDGLGMCEALAPDLFEVGDDGKVQVHDPEPAEELRDSVHAAVDACPVRALLITD